MRALGSIDGIRVLERSSAWESPSWHPDGEGLSPDYANIVAIVGTTLEPLELLDAIQAVEDALGRVREEDRLVVSEPFSDLPGLWVEIPEATALVVQPGDDVQVPFRPRVDETVNGRHPAGAA